VNILMQQVGMKEQNLEGVNSQLTVSTGFKRQLPPLDPGRQDA